jgi:hypothetical protein
MSPRQQPKSLIERAFGLVDSELERAKKCSGVLREQAENTFADKFVANYTPRVRVGCIQILLQRVADLSFHQLGTRPDGSPRRSRRGTAEATTAAIKLIGSAQDVARFCPSLASSAGSLPA